MSTPFVGRVRELRSLRRFLDAGYSVVLTGPFGSGRTSLVGELARKLRSSRFVAWKEAESRRLVRIAVRDAAIGARTSGSVIRSRVVLVVDDVVHLTAQRVRCLRELVRTLQCQTIVIVESSMPPDEIARLRAALGAARLLRLGPLSRRAVEQYFSESVRTLGLNWSSDEIRGTARATHGHPLTMHTTLEGVIGRERKADWERPVVLHMACPVESTCAPRER